MVEAVESIFFFFDEILSLFNSYSFNVWGVTVSLLDILLGGVILSFAISFLWRGARG